MSVTLESLQKEIADELEIELKNDADFNRDVLEVKVKTAIRDVMQRRNYSATSMKSEEIFQELYDLFYSTILNLARYDYNMIGAEGEANHSENGVQRTYVSRNSLLANVFAYVKFL